MKDIFSTLTPYENNQYDAIDIDRLVVFTAVELEKQGISSTLENITVGAFILFPQKFSITGYPQFPDATRVEKSLWRSKGRTRQWIGGKTSHGYLVTDRSRNIAQQIQNQLSGSVFQSEAKTSSRLRRREKVLQDAMNTPAYEKYINGEREAITESDFCYLLQGTLDSSKDTLKGNIISIKEFSQELDNKEFLKFLNWLEESFEYFLTGK